MLWYIYIYRERERPTSMTSWFLKLGRREEGHMRNGMQADANSSPPDRPSNSYLQIHVPLHDYTRLASNSAPTWSSRCCFAACHF